MKKNIPTIRCLCLCACLLSTNTYSNITDSFEVDAGIIERFSVNVNSMSSGVLIEAAPIDYSYSDWIEYGEPFNCTFEPSTSTILKGVKFNQTQACLQQEARNKYTYTYAELTNTEQEFRYVDAEREIERVGILTYSYVTEYSSWSNDGSIYSCGGYSPSTGSVNSGTSFTQTRTCSQNQIRTKYIYKVNDITSERSTDSLVTESRVISVKQSRRATGTKATHKWALDPSSNSIFSGYVLNINHNALSSSLSLFGIDYSGYTDVWGQGCSTVGKRYYYIQSQSYGYYFGTYTLIDYGFVFICQ